MGLEGGEFLQSERQHPVVAAKPRQLEVQLFAMTGATALGRS